MHKVYAVYDAVSKIYHRPFTLRNKGEAMREWTQLINAKEPNKYSMHPEDYTLYELGEWDDEHGVINPYNVTTKIAVGIEVKETVKVSNGH